MAKGLSVTLKGVWLFDFAASYCSVCKMEGKEFCGGQSDVILKLHKEALFSRKG